MLCISAVGNSLAFWTNLPFHEFLKIWNHERWLKNVWKIREKAGLSKTLMSCRRLLYFVNICKFDAMRCSLEFDALYFVKYLQDGFTNAHA
jgi:hypothetical protein